MRRMHRIWYTKVYHIAYIKLMYDLNFTPRTFSFINFCYRSNPELLQLYTNKNIDSSTLKEEMISALMTPQ